MINSRNLYVLKPDVHAPVCDLGMVGSSHTVSIGLRLTVVSNFRARLLRLAPRFDVYLRSDTSLGQRHSGQTRNYSINSLTSSIIM